MGERDIEEKILEDYNDVFADIINVLLFNGKQTVKPEQLENSKDRSMFKASNGRITDQERDVFKWWKKSRIKISLFGLENQTNPDPDMCFRLLGYDGAAYKSQYGSKKTKYPVITLVLFMNYKEHWCNNKRTLFDCLDIPYELKPYVNDYKMNLFEIAWLSDEQVKMFKSDFRIVADYLVQMRTNKEYRPSPQVIKHVDEIMKLMVSLTGDTRFTDVMSDEKIREKEMVSMCEALDIIQKRGEKIGEKRGEKIGEKRGNFMKIVEIVNNFVAKKALTQKAACEELSIDYKEYLAAKRYIKKLETAQSR